MKKIAGISAVLLTPVITFAQGADAFSILRIVDLFIKKLIPVLITAALAFFIYGVVRYVIATEPDAKEDYKKIIVRGIIGLFIILSVWGLVGVIQRTFGIGNTDVTRENLPTVSV